MLLKLKPIIAACAFVTISCIETQTGLGQAVVIDISTQLRQQQPAGYNSVGCGFISGPNPSSLWWLCGLYSEEEGEPFAWLAPLQENGILGQGSLLSSVSDKGLSWSSILAIGSGRKILARYAAEESPVAGLEIPTASNNQPIKTQLLWEYSMQSAFNKKNILNAEQAKVIGLGDYIVLSRDYSVEAYQRNKDYFIVSRLSNEGKKIWQYTYERSLFQGTSDYANEISNDVVKKLAVTSDQKTVIYGRAHRYKEGNSEVNGSILICLDQNGKEISNQFFKDHDWTQIIEWPNLGFGYEGFSFVDHNMANGQHSLNIFNQDCQKIADQPLNFSNHQYSGEVDNEIKATAMTQDGDLLIAYLQTEFPLDIDEMGGHLPLPSMYLAKFDRQGKLINDIDIVAGENKDRSYLVIDLLGEDELRITLAILPKTNEVLISVHNMEVNSETRGELQSSPYPRMYRVQLQ